MQHPGDFGLRPSASISVVIPTFNRAHLIERAIASIEGQILAPLEIIVVDDCSADDTPDRINKIPRGQIRLVYVRLDVNRGGGAARNAGIQRAEGDWIAFLDSDDEWASGHLSTLLSAAKNGGGDVVVASSVLVREKNSIVPKRRYPTIGSVDEKLHYVLSSGQAFQTSALLVPSHLAKRFLFDPSLRRHQDWDLLFRMIEQGVHLQLLPDATAIYHLADGNISISKSLTPSLRFLARHRRSMSRKSVARFLALEVARRKPSHVVAVFSILKAAFIRGMTLRELAYHVRARIRFALSAKQI